MNRQLFDLLEQAIAGKPVELRGKVRATDPETSWNAASLIDANGNLYVKEAILRILAHHGPLTHGEIHAIYRDAGGRRTENRVRTATKELVTAGHVRRSNVIGLTPLGNDSQKWEVVA